LLAGLGIDDLCRQKLIFRGLHIEPAFSVQLSPAKDLVRVNTVSSGDDRNRCARHQRLFDNPATFLREFPGNARDAV